MLFLMRFLRHEPKRQANLKKHGVNFIDAEPVLTGPLLTFQGDRKDDGEWR